MSGEALRVDSEPAPVNYTGVMNRKHEKIVAFVEPFHGRALDAHYLAFFDCFNRQLYYEAHEVLEALWLPQRLGPNGAFYKGLIQLAGAFVHLQKGRIGPALALLNLARANLKGFPTRHEGLEVEKVLAMLECWTSKLTCPRPPIGLLSLAPVAELRLPTPEEGTRQDGLV